MKRLILIACLLFSGIVQAQSLASNTTPAERAYGASAAYTFRSAYDVERNNGTIVGAPTFDAKDGVFMGGASQYITYAASGDEFASAYIGIVASFVPTNAYDFNRYEYIMDSSDASRYTIVKTGDAGSLGLAVLLGHVNIASIPFSTYAPYWVPGQRTTIVVSGTSGNTSVWINGVLILDQDPSAWTPKYPASIIIGNSYPLGAGTFAGTINYVKVFHNLFTTQDAINFHDNTTYTYPAKAIAALTMRLEDHDPTKSMTIDISGNGHDQTFEDVPTKLTTWGYEFDGTNDAMTGTGTMTADGYSIEAYASWDVASLRTIASIGLTGGGDTDTLGTGVQGGVGTNDEITFGHWTTSWQACSAGIVPVPGRLYHLVATNDSTNTRIYVDGELKNTCAGSELTVAQNLYVGRRHDAANKNYFDGEIKFVRLHGMPLTPLQVLDACVHARGNINSR